MAFHWIKSQLKNPSSFAHRWRSMSTVREKIIKRFCKRTSIYVKCDYETLVQHQIILNIDKTSRWWCWWKRDVNLRIVVSSPTLSMPSTRKQKTSSHSIYTTCSAAPTEHHWAKRDCFRGDRLFVQLLRSRWIAITLDRLIYLMKTNYLSSSLSPFHFLLLHDCL